MRKIKEFHFVVHFRNSKIPQRNILTVKMCSLDRMHRTYQTEIYIISHTRCISRFDTAFLYGRNRRDTFACVIHDES